MPNMECEAFVNQLDSWMDGERPAEARAHVATCPACRSLAEDFAAISAAAQTMLGDESEPPAYLWNSIRSQLEREGIIRHPRPGDLAACDAFVAQLDSWMEGIRPADARAHLAACQSCSALAGDFDAITSVARSMAYEAPEPPAYLWNSIRAQLQQEGIIREAHSAAVRPLTDWRGWFGLPRTALVGAFAAVLAIAGFFASGPLGRRINDYRWMQGTQNSTSPLSAQLDTVEHATVASLKSDPTVSAALHKNLAIVDNYIALCEKSVREDPQNEMARDFLNGAYQQKADLLAQINERGE